MNNNPFETIDARLSNIESLLLDIKHNPTPTTQDPDHWMSVDDLINYLPGKIAKQTIYQKCSRRELPHTNSGKKLLFLKSEIDTWLNSQKRKTISELKNEVDCSLGKLGE